MAAAMSRWKIRRAKLLHGGGRVGAEGYFIEPAVFATSAIASGSRATKAERAPKQVLPGFDHPKRLRCGTNWER